MKNWFLDKWNWIVANPLNFIIGLGIVVVSVIAIAIIVKVIAWSVRRR